MTFEESSNRSNWQLATVLSNAKNVSREGVLKASDLARGVKARLATAGCLIEILKGWYLLTSPGSDGSSTAWFGSFWSFVKYYLTDRFGVDSFHKVYSFGNEVFKNKKINFSSSQ